MTTRDPRLGQLALEEFERRMTDDFENAPPIEIDPARRQARKNAALKRVRQMLQDETAPPVPARKEANITRFTQSLIRQLGELLFPIRAPSFAAAYRGVVRGASRTAEDPGIKVNELVDPEQSWLPIHFDVDPEEGICLVVLQTRRRPLPEEPPRIEVWAGERRIETVEQDWSDGRLRLLIPALPADAEGLELATTDDGLTLRLPPLVADAPIEGMRIWIERGLHWLAQTLTGIDIAQGALVPATLLDAQDAPAPDPIQTLRANEVGVVAQSIRRDGDGWAITLRWLAPLPPAPPEVSVERGEVALGKVWEWTDWLDAPDRGQVLRIAGIDVDPEAGSADRPLVELAWDREGGRLWCRVTA